MCDSYRATRFSKLLIIFAALLAAAAAMQGCAGVVKSSTSQNPTTPQLNISVVTLPIGQVGTPYNAMLTATGGTAPYTWSLSSGTLPAGLTLNAAGAITGTPTQAVTNGPLTVRVTDSSSPAQTQTATLSLTVNAAASAVSITSTLPAATENTAYSQQLAATGGSGSYVWSLTTPVAGFSLSSAGLLTGTATSTTTLSFAVKATDSANSSNFGTATLKLTVNAAASAVSITSTLPAATENTAYSQQLAATGGSGSYVWSLTTPVAGFSLSSAGLLTGTATSTTTLSFAVKATDSANSSNFGTATLKLTVNAAASAVSITSTLPAATENAAYSQQLVATGGSGSYVWSLTTPVSGFSLSSAGLLTGTATSTTTLSFPVKATDSTNSSNFGTATLKLTVNAAATPVSITMTLPAATENAAYSQQLAATGGSGSYVWSLTTPVAGFSLSSAGLLTGTATSTTTLSFAVKATDSANSSNFGTATLMLTVNATSSGSAFYVSPSGSDSNAGTLSSPWRTIQHAADSVQAGDTVYVLAGTYNESVTIAVSGSSTAGPVSFISSPFGAAIVDGTGLTPSSSNTQGLFNIEDESYVTIQGFTIQNYTTSNANATPAGIWVTGSGSYINILNNTVTKITTSSEAEGNAFGIAVYGSEAPTAISYITITGNTVYDCKTGNSETVNVDGNVTNFTITSNTIHDNDNIGIDAIGFEGVSPDPAYDYARNGVIGENTVYNISAISNPGEGNQYDADGIYCDGCDNVIIERNNVSTSDLGIEVASEHSGHVSTYVTVRNNLVFNNNSVGISIGGYASNVGGTSYCTIVNNSLLENDSKSTGSGELQVQYYATNNVFENNIVYATSQSLFINNFTNSESSPLASDYNVFFSSTGESSANFVWNGTNYTGFTTYQSGAGQDGHSLYSNPQYLSLSLTTPNLQVETTSPAVNAGINLGTTVVGTVDYAGNPRVQGTTIDIGAYQQ